MPIFFALFRLVDRASREDYTQRGVLTEAHAESIQKATLFGAELDGRFMDLGSTNTMTLVLAVILVITMTASTFLTQKQLMSKNMPADAMTGQYAQTQKMMLYVLPVAFAFGGVAFPIGVLLYWTTSNAWTMGQQFYVIRNNPAPGTPAAQAKAERDAKHGKGPLAEQPAEGATATVTEEEEPPAPQRSQPKKQSRSQRQQSTKKPSQGQQASKNNQARNPGQAKKKKPKPDITKPNTTKPDNDGKRRS